MNGSDFIAMLPEKPGEAREQLILATVESGYYATIEWKEILLSYAGHEAKVFVSCDALRIGDDDDSVRVTTSHLTAQRIADRLDCVLVTAKLSDLIYYHADVKLAPHTQTPDRKMAYTSRMVQHHEAVEAELDGRTGLVAPVGKDWANTNRLKGRPGRAANYGWHSPTGRYQAVTQQGGRVWQPGPGITHVAGFTDYSQVVRLVRRTMMVKPAGTERFVEMDIDDVARDSTLCGLVSSEGPVVMRHPAVARPQDGQEAEAAVEPVPHTVRPTPVFTRTLRRGMVGEDVRVVQRVIGADDDGIFGPKTEALVKDWQVEQGLVADGIVGPRSRRAILAQLTPEIVATQPEQIVVAEPSVLDIPYKEAANYTRGVTRNKVDLIVIHSAEAAEKPSTAEALATWVAGPDAPRASWHFAIDCDSITQSVHENQIAWHCPAANYNGIGIEHAGYARQSRDEWLDPYSESMLYLSARLVAQLCQKWKIPVEYLEPEDLLAGKRGITTHMNVTRAIQLAKQRGMKHAPWYSETRGKWAHTDHADPGQSWPMDLYLDWVKEAA